MRVLSALEDRLERVVNRLFSRRERFGVHPIEIARALARAMEAKQSLSVDKIYVPNVFHVHLHPVDLQSLGPIRQTIERDVTQYCTQVARRRGYDFAGPLQLVLADDDLVHTGTIRVDVTFLEAPDASTERTKIISQTMDETQRRPGHLVEPSPGFILNVLDGPDKGKSRVWSEKEAMTIGRSVRCDFVLSDGQVSNVHAKIGWRGTGWQIEDLNSTNGVLKNGMRLSDAQLEDGDELTMGATTLRFVQEE